MAFTIWAFGLFFPVAFLLLAICEWLVEWLTPSDDENEEEYDERYDRYMR